MSIKKLPVGIQSYRKIIQGNYCYVDKTKLAKDLIDDSKYSFMSRPRRFGKSLFLDTLKEIFSGNKDLFQDCYIAKSNYDWQMHPVISFDFTQILNSSTEKYTHQERQLAVIGVNFSNETRNISGWMIKTFSQSCELIKEYSS